MSRAIRNVQILLGPNQESLAHIIRPVDFRMASSPGSSGRAARLPALPKGRPADVA